jgi:hypothetical protein
MLTETALRSFDTIYAADLVFVPDCWKLCGDAHCCNFQRYKSQLGLLGGTKMQELPLLPGEMEYIRSKGHGRDFGAYEHRVTEITLRQGKMRLEFLMGREKTCACAHDTRTVVCRLYPLLPVFDVSGRLVGVNSRLGAYELIESIDGLERACKVDSLPFDEMQKFIDIANAIAAVPKFVFYCMAYEVAKAHAAEKLRALVAEDPKATALNSYEAAFLLRRLFDAAELKAQLEALADRFIAHYGDAFSLEGPPVTEGGSTIVSAAGEAPVPLTSGAGRRPPVSA